tara:strand:+ start:138 stop:425 length:288 start_codon:yes stop_codon:yes gene_type:complete
MARRHVGSDTEGIIETLVIKDKIMAGTETTSLDVLDLLYKALIDTGPDGEVEGASQDNDNHDGSLIVRVRSAKSGEVTEWILSSNDIKPFGDDDE